MHVPDRKPGPARGGSPGVVSRDILTGLDRLRRTPVTDVHATAEEPQWPGHELRDLRIGPIAEGAAHRSPQHHTSNPHLNARTGRMVG